MNVEVLKQTLKEAVLMIYRDGLLLVTVNMVTMTCLIANVSMLNLLEMHSNDILTLGFRRL